MSEPTFVPDRLDQASEDCWSRSDLEQFMAGAEPFREDESFEIADLTDDEWATYVRAIHK